MSTQLRESPILDQYGRPLQLQRRASIDAAKTTDENRKHWAAADGLAPSTQLTPHVRQTVANRALYECQNNTYGAGMIRTLVGDTIGTTPRLQVTEDDDALNENVEDLWNTWASLIDLPMKLRVLAGVKYVMGEGLGYFRLSKKLAKMNFPVDLDVKLVEPAQCTDGIMSAFHADSEDGVILDDDDEVVGYKILARHPNDYRSLTAKPVVHQAENVIHWFQPERPDQRRGLSPLVSALPIFAQLRRYSSATLTNAEWSAMITGVIESDYPAGDMPEQDDSINFRAVDFVRGTLLTLPRGVKAKGFDPTQPTTTYESFVNAKLREIGRCINMPFGKIAGDHSRYNYSSSRMDNEAYWKDRDIERQDFEAKVLDRLFHTFLVFARDVVPALAMRRSNNLWTLRHTWHYDARPTSDPVKDATADEMNLTNGSDTLSAIAARDGTTVDRLARQRRRDLDTFARYGLTPPPWAIGQAAPVRQPEQPALQGAA